jgi:uncharacterized iron-regulated membrane protein
LANQTPLSLLELIGKTIIVLLASGVLLVWAFHRQEKPYAGWAILRPAPRHSHPALATIPVETVDATDCAQSAN